MKPSKTQMEYLRRIQKGERLNLHRLRFSLVKGHKPGRRYYWQGKDNDPTDRVNRQVVDALERNGYLEMVETSEELQKGYHSYDYKYVLTQQGKDFLKEAS